MALGLVVATDLANALLPHHTRGKVLKQTEYDKPLLQKLKETQKTFPAGNRTLTDPVQGAFISDTQGALQGYSEDDALTFNQAQNILRTSANWYEVHMGLWISWTEMKKDGITFSDNNKSTEHSDREVDILTDLLENRMDDFAESWSRMMNYMFWWTGAQDAKQVPGLTSILTDTPAQGTTMGLNRATYPWWQHRAMIGATKITPSATDQTLSRTLRSELRQLRVYGGKPNLALCGSAFIDALELEIQEKGDYTTEGFAKGKNDLGMNTVVMKGLGEFTFDPSMDQHGFSKRCYIIDSRRITLRPMEGEENKITTPERPYNYMVFFRSMTWTGGLVATQLNCHGIYEVA